MRGQISRAIVGVALLLVLGLGIPLAVVVQRFYADEAVADLHRRAAETITEIALPLDPDELASIAAESDAPGPFGVYDPTGRRIFGVGPVTADVAVRAALRGAATVDRADGALVVGAPLTERTSETIVGAVRIDERVATVDARVRRAWFAMSISVAIALVGAWLLARSQGRRLAEPVIELARHAEDLGRGEFAGPPAASGVPEIDTVAEALAASGDRLASILARERAFSAEVAHQLRTPLTGLRLRLERLAGEEGASGELAAVLGEVARLEDTIEHLLALARDRHHVVAVVDTAAVLTALADRWEARFRDAGRRLVVEPGTISGPVRGTFVSISQVLDVLVDNGFRHGEGEVLVRARAVAGGAVIEVADGGAGIAEGASVFERTSEGHGDHGIGLALARRIAEAEGGRLLLASSSPACFHLALADPDG